MASELTKLAARMAHMDKPCSCGSGKTAKVCGCRHEKGSEIEKLSARLKMKCPHCGVKHASEGCGCSQRSEPMKPAVRRDRTQAYYPEPTKVAQLHEVQKLREKIAVLPALGAAAAAIAPHVARLGATTAGRYVAAKAAPMALNAGMNALTAGPGMGNKLRAAGAGAATGLLPGSGIATQLGAAALQPKVNEIAGVR